MREKLSLSFQRQCVEHLIALCHEENSTVVEGALQAALTLGWLERHGEALKMLEVLRRERPDLYATMRVIASEFPGVKIDGIRETAG